MQAGEGAMKTLELLMVDTVLLAGRVSGFCPGFRVLDSSGSREGGGVQVFRAFEEIWALGLRVAGDMEFRLPASPQAGKTFFGLRARMIWIMFAQNKYSED